MKYIVTYTKLGYEEFSRGCTAAEVAWFMARCAIDGITAWVEIDEGYDY